MTLLVIGCARVFAATTFYVSPSGSNIVPYADWTTAATNIQDAVNAASAGDTVLVTNGLYSSGGKVMAGDLVNRVALDKALTVQSVNGPWNTVIQGLGPIGTTAVRCAWLADGASLVGFTLRSGATRGSPQDAVTLQSGGGVWCSSSSNTIIANCIISSNAASVGGGAYQGTFHNCGFLTNAANSQGSAVYNAILNSCTIIGNLGALNAVSACKLTNCIAYFNSVPNYSGSTPSYCCTTPAGPGIGNITSDPQLLGDQLHLSSTSSCRGAGISRTYGTDIDGQQWASPPSIGCDQFAPEPVVRVQPNPFTAPQFVINSLVVGQPPFGYWWLKDGSTVDDGPYFSGSHTSSLTGSLLNPQQAGAYQLVASNSDGTTISAVVQIGIHYVNATNSTPLAPYTNWNTAATIIQDAIDAAAVGQAVVVTNGVYSSGGKVMSGDLTNRIAVDKALFVTSVNGPAVTVIQGARDPATNGPAAIRCAWLTNGAVLSGFRLQGGATRAATTSPDTQQYGGGVYGASTNALVVNCIIASNSAASSAGGAGSVTLSNCVVIGNMVGPARKTIVGLGGGVAVCNVYSSILEGNSCNGSLGFPAAGGGATFSTLVSCALKGNSTSVSEGGAAKGGTLINCTVTGNSSGGAFPTAVANAFVTNCIVVGNFPSNIFSSPAAYSCTSPLAAGVGNITADPQLLADGVHLAENSPCRSAGLWSVVSGLDIDGQLWTNPPSMGCDEWLPIPVMAVQSKAWVTGIPPSLNLGSQLVAGHEPFSFGWSKNGVPLDDGPHYAGTHTPKMTAGHFGPTDAGDYQVIVTNGFGAATASVEVIVHCVDPMGTAAAAPYSDWGTAAPMIQEAIDAANPGDFVLVTNGVYSSGGRVMEGDLTNRIALHQPVTVTSMNGPEATVIEGAWDPVSTNGPLAVRCAWLADGAVLNGFTLRKGATRTNWPISSFQSGGGAVGNNLTNCFILNSVITSNAANYWGGGCYNVTLDHCIVISNWSKQYGGGIAMGSLSNCFVSGNVAVSLHGGGAYYSHLVNSTVTGNSAAGAGGGIYIYRDVYVRNSIISSNSANVASAANWSYLFGPLNILYTCTTPLAPGAGNIAVDPQLLDGLHIAVTSPCRGVGDPSYTSGTDIDGEPWTNPPSMGCDEVWEANLTGPLSVTAKAAWPTVAAWGSLPLAGTITGKATRAAWDFGDGSSLTNGSYVNTSHIWTNEGDYVVTFTAYNTDLPSGVSTNLTVHVVPLVAPQLFVGGLNGTNFTLSFPGQPGVAYVVEQATNLASPVLWKTVTSVSSTGSVMQVTDTKATNAARYYRVRSQ